MQVEKYEKDGKVAVLYSPGYGAGWSTWGKKEMALDARLVIAFIRDGIEGVMKSCEKHYPNEYTGGATNLEIVWIDKGTHFTIEEYDGNESIQIEHSDYWCVA